MVTIFPLFRSVIVMQSIRLPALSQVVYALPVRGRADFEKLRDGGFSSVLGEYP